jgi:hypothetical protein
MPLTFGDKIVRGERDRFVETMLAYETKTWCSTGQMGHIPRCAAESSIGEGKANIIVSAGKAFGGDVIWAYVAERQTLESIARCGQLIFPSHLRSKESISPIVCGDKVLILHRGFVQMPTYSSSLKPSP